MSLTTPAINNARLKMEVLPSVVTPLFDKLPIDLPIFLNSVANLQVTSGSYTPNNDTLSLASAIPNGVAPNFIILITAGQANLTVKSGGTVLLNSNPVMKVYMNCMIQNSTYNITDILLDGTTAASTPMTQAVQINYTLIYGQADIS